MFICMWNEFHHCSTKTFNPNWEAQRLCGAKSWKVCGSLWLKRVFLVDLFCWNFLRYFRYILGFLHKIKFTTFRPHFFATKIQIYNLHAFGYFTNDNLFFKNYYLLFLDDEHPLEASAATLKAIQHMFSSQVFLPIVADRFWEAAIHLVNKHSEWIDHCLA